MNHFCSSILVKTTLQERIQWLRAAISHTHKPVQVTDPDVVGSTKWNESTSTAHHEQEHTAPQEVSGI